VKNNLKHSKIIKLSQDDEPEKSGETAVIRKPKLEEPKMYNVLLLNDDYTTMEFVVHVLKKFFSKTPEQANAIMLKIHHAGVCSCGIYTFEIAETKSLKVNRYARDKGHPLKSIIEPCEN